MLAGLQQQMAETLRHSDEVLADASLFAKYDSEELKARLTIYRNNFFFSVIEVLKDTYPTVEKLVGEEFFSAACKKYIENKPPDNPVLIELGSNLPEFLDTFEPLANYPYIPDVARLDFYRHQSWYAENIASLNAENFAEFDISALANAHIELHPSLRWLSSEFSIFSIWLANQSETSDKLEPNTPEIVLIVRPENEVETYKLDPGTLTFIQKLGQNLSIGESLHLALEGNDNFNPSEAINFLMTSGVASKMKCNENTD